MVKKNISKNCKVNLYEYLQDFEEESAYLNRKLEDLINDNRIGIKLVRDKRHLALAFKALQLRIPYNMNTSFLFKKGSSEEIIDLSKIWSKRVFVISIESKIYKEFSDYLVERLSDDYYAKRWDNIIILAKNGFAVGFIWLHRGKKEELYLYGNSGAKFCAYSGAILSGIYEGIKKESNG